MNYQFSPNEIVALYKILSGSEDPRLAKLYSVLTKDIVSALSQRSADQLDAWLASQRSKIASLQDRPPPIGESITGESGFQSILNDDDDQVDVQSRYPKKRAPAPNMPRFPKKK